VVTADATLSVEVVGCEEELGPLVRRWRELAAARQCVFATPDWYLTAMRSLDRDAVPAVAVARSQDGVIKGLIPLLSAGTHRGRRRAFAPARRFADAFEPVAELGFARQVASACAPALAAHLGRRSRIDLGRVVADARWWRELARSWPGRMCALPASHETLPQIELAGMAWEKYLAGRSRGLRNDVGRKMRSLRRDHRVELRRSAGADEVRSDMDTLFRLHAARWEMLGGVSAMADAAVREFHGDLARAMQEQGWLRLYLLEVDGGPVAAWYGWRVGDRFSYYQAGFDPDWSRHSVGFLLLAETIREAIAEGAADYDLLRGEEGFKARFANAERHTSRVVVAPVLSGTRIATSFEILLRRLFHALPSSARQRLRRIRGRLRRAH
jgi:CelD/BcsL family acetyltransferase involved in cellulose biosynthesis